MVLKESRRFLAGGVRSPLRTDLPECQQVTHQTHLTVVSHCTEETNLV